MQVGMRIVSSRITRTRQGICQRKTSQHQLIPHFCLIAGTRQATAMSAVSMESMCSSMPGSSDQTIVEQYGHCVRGQGHDLSHNGMPSGGITLWHVKWQVLMPLSG